MNFVLILHARIIFCQKEVNDSLLHFSVILLFLGVVNLWSFKVCKARLWVTLLDLTIALPSGIDLLCQRKLSFLEFNNQLSALLCLEYSELCHFHFYLLLRLLG